MKPIAFFLTILTTFASLSSFAGDSLSEKTIFEALVKEGAFVNYRFSSPSELPGTGDLRLKNLNCSKDSSSQAVEFECRFIDERRPFEAITFVGENAQIIFQSLLAEGIPYLIVPFSRGKILSMNAANLHCSKAGFVEDKIKYECFMMKRLVN